MVTLPKELEVIRVKASSRMGGKPDTTANRLCSQRGFSSFSGQANLLSEGAIPPKGARLFATFKQTSGVQNGFYELFIVGDQGGNGQQPQLLAKGRYYRVAADEHGHYSINVNCAPEGEWAQLASMVLYCPNPNHKEKNPEADWVPTRARPGKKEEVPDKTRVSGPVVTPPQQIASTTQSAVSVVAGYKFVRVDEVDVAQVAPFPGQPRKRFHAGKLQELGESIRQMGLQQLIQVRVLKPDEPQYSEGFRYMLVDGERRLRAHHLIKKPRIGVLVVEVGDRSEQYLRSLVLNLHQEPHSHYELALAVIEMVEARKGDANSVARDLGRTPAWVYSYLGLRSLERQLFELLDPDIGEAKQLRLQHAVLLAKMKPEVQVSVYEQAVLKRTEGVSKMTAFLKAQLDLHKTEATSTGRKRIDNRNVKYARDARRGLERILATSESLTTRAPEICRVLTEGSTHLDHDKALAVVGEAIAKLTAFKEAIARSKPAEPS